MQVITEKLETDENKRIWSDEYIKLLQRFLRINQKNIPSTDLRLIRKIPKNSICSKPDSFAALTKHIHYSYVKNVPYVFCVLSFYLRVQYQHMQLCRTNV